MHGIFVCMKLQNKNKLPKYKRFKDKIHKNTRPLINKVDTKA